MIKKLFHQESDVLMNTGMLYSNAIAAQAETLGFKGHHGGRQSAMLKGFQSNEVFLAPWVYTTTTIFRNRNCPMTWP